MSMTGDVERENCKGSASAVPSRGARNQRSLFTEHGIRLFHDPETPRELTNRVLARIAHARLRAARLRLAALGAVMALSAPTLWISLQYAMHELYISGFYDYLSLALSAPAYWQDLSLSLVESLPSLAILAFVAAALAFCWSLWRSFRHLRVVINPRFA